MNGPHRGARRIRGQPSPGADRPLLGTPAHAGGAVEDTAVGVLADAEHHLKRVVPRMCDGPDLLGPRRIGLTDCRERVHDLVSQQFVLGDQVPVVGRQHVPSSSQRPSPAVGGDPKNSVISVPRSYSRIQVSAHGGRGWCAGSWFGVWESARRQTIFERWPVGTALNIVGTPPRRVRLRRPPGPRNLSSSTSRAGDISSSADAPRSANGMCSSKARAMFAATALVCRNVSRMCLTRYQGSGDRWR